jgi:rare lipoprotein A
VSVLPRQSKAAGSLGSSRAIPIEATGTGLATALAALVLAGCASAPQRGAERDGPPAQPPAGLAQLPDAEPRLEAVRRGGPNKPYEALGREYVPITDDRPFAERGLASWYGRKFQGLPTSSGEPYDMYAMTAAHPTLPIPSYARVRNPANGREVVVRINDRGPFRPGRIIDLSYTAALKLDLLRGVAPVEVERITADAIRSGAWQRIER